MDILTPVGPFKDNKFLGIQEICQPRSTKRHEYVPVDMKQ